MFEQTDHGETPTDSAQEAAEGLDLGRMPDPQEEPHDDHCRCAYCARELKDESSITAGYGPVCAKNRDLPWGGSGQEQAEEYVPTWERLAVLQKACQKVLVVARRVQSWTRRRILRHVRALVSKVRHQVLLRTRRSIIPWLRSAWSRWRRTRLARVVERQWLRIPPRAQRAALALCAISAAIVLLAGIRNWLVVDSSVAQPRRAARATNAAAAPAVEIHEVTQPALVHVRVGPAESVWTVSARQRRQLAGAATRQILPVLQQQPDQVVVIKLRDVPLSYSQLSAADRIQVQQRFGPFAAKRYESAVAAFLNATITAVQREHPRAVLSVLGLPIEPEEAGVSLEIARLSNERYGAVIDGLGPFVPARRLVVFGSTLDETLLARMGMREALRLRDGRPIVFQLNTAWQALVDRDGLDYQEYLVARASGEIERHRGATRVGNQATEVQVMLGDDPYWDP